jgi:hypothetical protein
VLNRSTPLDIIIFNAGGGNGGMGQPSAVGPNGVNVLTGIPIPTPGARGVTASSYGLSAANGDTGGTPRAALNYLIGVFERVLLLVDLVNSSQQIDLSHDKWPRLT